MKFLSFHIWYVVFVATSESPISAWSRRAIGGKGCDFWWVVSGYCINLSVFQEHLIFCCIIEVVLMPLFLYNDTALCMNYSPQTSSPLQQWLRLMGIVAWEKNMTSQKQSRFFSMGLYNGEKHHEPVDLPTSTTLRYNPGPDLKGLQQTAVE